MRKVFKCRYLSNDMGVANLREYVYSRMLDRVDKSVIIFAYSFGVASLVAGIVYSSLSSVPGASVLAVGLVFNNARRSQESLEGRLPS